MPGQEDSYDLIRVQDAQANSKADTFFISPKELGTDETQVRRVVLEALDGDMTGGVEVSSLTGDKLSVDSSGNLTASGVGPDDAEYVVLSSDPDLANAQVHANLSGSDLHDPSDHALGGGSHSADTLAKLNSLVSNATLDDTGDARDPTTHGTTHQNGGSDELNVEGLSGDLADAQDPKSHSTTHENGGGDELAVDGLSGDLADAQDPKAHASTHSDGGADEITVENLGTGGAAGTVPTSDGAGGLTMSPDAGDATSDAARVFLSTTQSIPAASRVKVEFDSEAYDIGNNFDAGTHNYTCPQDGVYLAAVQITYNIGGSSDERRAVVGNATDDNPSNEGSFISNTPSDRSTRLQAVSFTDYSAGDTIAFYAENRDSSDALNDGTLTSQTHAQVVYLGNP
jgi:hypothetical protein